MKANRVAKKLSLSIYTPKAIKTEGTKLSPLSFNREKQFV
jgi:hypothetical protein